MTYPMSISQMTEILGKLDATNCGDAEAVANFILHNLSGYQRNINGADRAFMTTAIQAYAKLLQDAGVKVI